MNAFMSPKDEYNYYYNRLYPLLKEGRIDFAQVAMKTGFKERKIRETFLFRLTAGEVRQLFGKKEGCCYICNMEFSMSSKEPLCLSCLQSIDSAIQELQLRMAEHEALASNLRTRGEEQGPLPGEGAELPELIPRAQYEALLDELNHYRRMAGALPPEDSPPPEPPVDTPAPYSQPEPLQAGLPADSLLGILTMDDAEIAGEDIVLPTNLLQPSAPLRHFGFQRLKS